MAGELEGQLRSSRNKLRLTEIAHRFCVLQKSEGGAESVRGLRDDSEGRSGSSNGSESRKRRGCDEREAAGEKLSRCEKRKWWKKDAAKMRCVCDLCGKVASEPASQPGRVFAVPQQVRKVARSLMTVGGSWSKFRPRSAWRSRSGV